MLSFKICMIGSFAVGKTSLVSQFVHSIFSDTYLSTVGVKISKKIVQCKNKQITLILWDLEGKDCFAEINSAYLRGASAFFIVADRTRRETLKEALVIRDQVPQLAQGLPYCVLINKSDLLNYNEILAEDLHVLNEEKIPFLETSAKTGLGVEKAFLDLAEQLV